MVLAGGTMDPLPTLAADFFPSLVADPAAAGANVGAASENRSSGSSASVLRHFSCGHVIAPDQLATLAVCKGPGNVPLDFRASHGRDSDRMIDELGRLLRNSMSKRFVTCTCPYRDHPGCSAACLLCLSLCLAEWAGCPVLFAAQFVRWYEEVWLRSFRHMCTRRPVTPDGRRR